MRRKSRFETFNDGVMEVCTVSKRAMVETKLRNMRFGDKTVGVKRYWEAQVSGNTVNRMVCVPMTDRIARDDIVVIGDRQHRVLQVQEKFDTYPPCLYLSLESIQIPYRDERKDNGENSRDQ